MKRFFYFFFLFLLSAGIFCNASLFAKNSSIACFKKEADNAFYLDLIEVGHEVIDRGIIGTPPEAFSALQEQDEAARELVAKNATAEEKTAAAETIDNVFAYSTILGDQFNFKNLPQTAAFFKKVDTDTSAAGNAAKKTFQRPRPMKSTGFSYPSNHSTRAFVREALLAEVFPNCQEALYNQALQFAQNRVILGRHYPRDIAAGEIYGKYLATCYLKNADFQAEWDVVKKEITALIPATMNPVTIPLVMPAVAPIVPPIVPIQE